MKTIKYIVSGSVLLSSLLMAGTALAAEQGQGGPWGGSDHLGHGPTQGTMMRGGHASATPGVVGVVSSVDGTTLTVDSVMRKMGSKTAAATTTYTVDASNAVVTKDNATSTVSAIATGDMVFVEGTVTGTNVTAKRIHDGQMRRPGMMGGDKKMRMGSTTPKGGMNFPLGNGQPLIGGSVTAINGNTVTVTNKGGVTYTVDVTSAKISKHGVTSATVTDITVGDAVVIQGGINGTSVTATLVVDQGTRPALDSTTSGTSTDTNNNQGERKGLMGAVGGFFSHLFGF